MELKQQQDRGVDLGLNGMQVDGWMDTFAV